MVTVFLLSHFPDQRFLKRIAIANNVSETFLIYQDRGNNIFDSKELYEVINSKNIYVNIWGKGKSRIEALKLFTKFAINKLKALSPCKIHVGNMDMLCIAAIYRNLWNKKLEIIYEVADLNKLVFNDSRVLKDKFKRETLIKIEKMLLKNVSHLILTSPYFWEDFYKNKFKKQKYFFIPNSPNREIIYEHKKENRENEIKIGFIGVVRYKEQLENLLKLTMNRNEINVLVAGEGPDKNYLKNKYKENKNIEFFGSYDYKEEANNLYNSVDLIYAVYDTKLPNVRIALPNRLYEAIVCAKPIIVAKNTKLGELVQELGVGFLVNAYNKEDLDELLTMIQENPNILEEKKNNCRNIKDKFYFDSYIPILEELYK